jgi:hypothetical protein
VLDAIVVSANILEAPWNTAAKCAILPAKQIKQTQQKQYVIAKFSVDQFTKHATGDPGYDQDRDLSISM